MILAAADTKAAPVAVAEATVSSPAVSAQQDYKRHTDR